MSALTAEQITAAQDLKRKEVEVPEWGGTVWIQTMTGTQRDEFDNSIQAAKSNNGQIDIRGIKARLVALTMVDAEGVPIFSDPEVLGTKSAGVLNRLWEVAQRLNGLSEADAEEMVKN